VFTPKSIHGQPTGHVHNLAGRYDRIGYALLRHTAGIMLCAALFSCGEDPASPSEPDVVPLGWRPVWLDPPPVQLPDAGDQRRLQGKPRLERPGVRPTAAPAR
jgi:hypothetical protein